MVDVFKWVLGPVLNFCLLSATKLVVTFTTYVRNLFI